MPWEPVPYIQLGPIKLFPWGLMFALGFLVASELAARKAKAYDIPPEKISQLTVYVLVGAVVGGRLGYVLPNLSDYKNVLDVFKVWEGGMAFYGGFFGGMAMAVPFVRREKLSYLRISDLVAPYVVLGYAITRLGCHIVGDHFGTPTDVPWAILHGGDGRPELPRHPVSLYHMAAALILFAVLLRLQAKNFFRGAVFFTMLAGYGAVRFLVEFFRDEPFFYGLHQAQWVSLGLLLAGAAGLLWARKRPAPEPLPFSQKKQAKR